ANCTCNAASRSCANDPDRALANNDASHSGLAAAAEATTAACDTDTAPARNAASVVGKSPSAFAVDTTFAASPTLTLVAPASPAPGDLAGPRAHPPVACTRPIAKVLIDAASRSTSAADSTTRCASTPSSRSGTNCCAT